MTLIMIYNAEEDRRMETLELDDKKSAIMKEKRLFDSEEPKYELDF